MLAVHLASGGRGFGPGLARDGGPHRLRRRRRRGLGPAATAAGAMIRPVQGEDMSTQGPFRLDGRVAAVIGAGSGIGEAVAVGAARAGARVVCLDLEARQGGSRSRRRLRPRAVQARRGIDIRRGGGRRSRPSTTSERHGRLDVVVCTPSINVRKTDPRLHRRGARPRPRPQHEGQLQRAARGGPHHDRAAQRQHRALLVDPIAGRRARPGRLRRDQGRHRPARAHRRRGVRAQRRARQRGRSRRDRDAAHRADQGQQGVVRGLRGQERLQPVGASRTRWSARRCSSPRTPPAT